MNYEQLVITVIAAADNKIIGRIRMQKMFYLLDQLGLGSGFTYEYQHYGPYSSELSEAIDDARAFAGVEEDIGRRQSDGVPYIIFKLNKSSERPGQSLDKHILSAIAEINHTSATIFELAATIHWLSEKENVSDWKSELIRRKGSKTEGGRMEQARKFLDDLGLGIS